MCKSSACPRHQDRQPPLSPQIPSCLLTRGGPPKVLEKHDHRLREKPLVVRLALWVVVEVCCGCILSVEARRTGELDSSKEMMLPFVLAWQKPHDTTPASKVVCRDSALFAVSPMHRKGTSKHKGLRQVGRRGERHDAGSQLISYAPDPVTKPTRKLASHRHRPHLAHSHVYTGPSRLFRDHLLLCQANNLPCQALF